MNASGRRSDIASLLTLTKTTGIDLCTQIASTASVPVPSMMRWSATMSSGFFRVSFEPLTPSSPCPGGMVSSQYIRNGVLRRYPIFSFRTQKRTDCYRPIYSWSPKRPLISHRQFRCINRKRTFVHIANDGDNVHLVGSRASNDSSFGSIAIDLT